MKFGVNILNFGPGANPALLARRARAAEALGYDFLTISDHVAVTADVAAQYPAPFYDPFTVLAWLAGITEKVELGTSVIVLPYRHPLLTARMAANIDQLSGGRFILGAGAGWAKQEFEALGIPFERRGAITGEYLEIIRKCWSGAVVSHDGHWVSFRGVHTGPPPARAPHPPIWVGGSSEAALRRAVRYGDGWHPIRFRMEWLQREGLPALRRVAAAEELAVPALCPRINLQILESPPADRLAGQGTLDQIEQDIAELAALGAQYVLLDPYGGKPETTAEPEREWSMLARFTERQRFRV